MAAAEARPLHKHSATHFPAKADDYRAPKPLSTSSASSSILEFDAANDIRAHGSDSQTQPAKVDDLSIGIVHQTPVLGKEHQNTEEFSCRTCKKYDGILDALNDKSANTTKKTDSMDEFLYTDYHFMDFNAFNAFISKQGQKLSSDLDSHWTEAEKTKPWWRSAGKDELASLVAQKSLENLENCDLPQPRTKHHRKYESSCLGRSDSDYFIMSSCTDTQFSSLDRYSWGIHSSPNMDERRSIVGNVDHFSNFPDQSFSSSRRRDTEDINSSISNVDPGKAQLLEALCHSQTRAREAERAAQQADTEKKHIISLFLRQASQLFAYKQWFQLLQLENFYLQLRSDDTRITDRFPDVSPLAPCKENQHRTRRKRRGRAWWDKISKYDVAFAVGLGLASAGLLLGWTMGWLFPTV